MKGKGNDGTGNNPNRDLWETEQTFWNKLDEQYNFSYDCCANHENTKCKQFSNRFEEVNYIGECDVCWMNPPFSKAFEMFEHFFKIVNKGVCIFRCDNMETKVWQDIIFKNASWVFIPKGRVNYTPFDISIRAVMTRFPSALIGFNVEPLKYFKDGTLLYINKVKEDERN